MGQVENPMLRTGLAFAGAQDWLQGSSLPDFLQPVVLTAQDVCTMKLQGTTLVMLSTCVSGLGDIVPAEGVISLARAFLMAGAQSVAFTLWSVSDAAQLDFVTRFYDAWLVRSHSKASALKEAQREMKITYPNHPYKWGGIVLIGSP